MNRTIDFAALALRLVGGGLMLTHGIPKLVQVFNGDFGFVDPLGIGPTFSLFLTVFAEAVCAFCLLFGFKTKWVAIPLIITMIVAAFVVHSTDSVGTKEMALLYLGIYISIFFLGSGRYSVDYYIK